jgi:cytochrome c6
MNKTTLRNTLLLLVPLIAAPVVAIAATATEAWSEHCARCHAADGSGNTKVGKKMKAKDYTKADVQAGMTDAAIVKAITEGVFDENKKERMAAYKDKLSEKEIKDLAAHVRTFKK